MIRWCSYCQRFLGEKAPYEEPTFSHGICEPCDARLDRGERLQENTEAVRRVFKRMVELAVKGDEPGCASALEEARALGLGVDSVLVGLLQPALYRAGLDWEGSRMSVVAEHRFTQWCERMFALLPPLKRSSPPLDLLIFQAPGNTHTVGPRFAAHVLASRGLSTDVIVPDVPFEEMVVASERARPRFIGLSCSLPASVPAATALLQALRARLEPALGARYLLSGFAFRAEAERATKASVAADLEVVVDLDYFTPYIRAGHG